MFNSFGSPEGYDYLSDVRSFGDTVMNCLERVPLTFNIQKVLKAIIKSNINKK